MATTITKKISVQKIKALGKIERYQPQQLT